MTEIDRDNEQFNQGVTHTVELLAKTISAPDTWVSGDGSEDYDTDLSTTLLNILAAKGLYEPDECAFPGEWMPIETAPKNRILLCGFLNSLGKWRSMHAQWRDDLPQHDMAEAEDEPAEAGWYEGSLEAEMLFPVRPTHWQYLPAPPPVA